MISRTEFQSKHGTAERWHVCDCDDCLAGLGIVTCPAPAPTFTGATGLVDCVDKARTMARK